MEQDMLFLKNIEVRSFFLLIQVVYSGVETSNILLKSAIFSAAQLENEKKWLSTFTSSAVLQFIVKPVVKVT